MDETVQRKARHRTANCRKRLISRNSSHIIGTACSRQHDDNLLSCMSASTSALIYASKHTSFVTLATSSITTATVSSHNMCLTGCRSTSALCNTQKQTFYCSSINSGEKSEQQFPLRLSISTSDDDEMNVDSPDSGFESSTPSGASGDYFDDNSKSDTFDVLSKASVSRNSSCIDLQEENRICLIRPPKPEPISVQKESPICCKWKGCEVVFVSNRDLHEHLNSDHVDRIKERFCCLWIGCKVHDMPARSITWLKQHVATHTGDKRFKCVLDGCDASFTSQQGLARHVPSHFNEVNLPKARVSSHNERRFLVKRRKIKDKKKALANIHDCVDDRTVSTMLASLVRHVNPHPTSFPTNSPSDVVTCKRCCNDGSQWNLSSNQTWIKGDDDAYNGFLFFNKPKPRCRKNKMLH